jgi:hypothetical protein
MALATASTVRTLLLLCLLLSPVVADAEPATEPSAEPRPAPAAEKAVEPREPLWEAELQLGYGMSQRSSAEMTDTGLGPMSFAAIGAVAVNQEPSVFAFGGLVGEAIGRTAVGVTSGVRMTLPELPIRFGGGGVWMVAPRTLWGATASAGACLGKGKLGLCGDVQLTAYFAGTALPKDELELQVGLVVGVVARGGL